MNEAKWATLKAIASRYAGKPVLYCLIFSHGLMKVGRTGNIQSRLEALSAHGLLKPMAMDLVVQPLDRCSSDAEKIALKRFSSLCQQHGPEIFSVVSLDLVKSVLSDAAALAKVKDPKPELTDEAFDALSRSSGMYAAMIHLAIERARDTGMHERALQLTQIVESTPPDRLNEVVRDMLGKSTIGVTSYS